jgi:uncharacterized protein (UPF0264 family)
VAKLLVSVRSAIEAQAALAGGAAIVDVKEPRNGALGRAEIEVCRQVVNAAGTAVTSAALGELNEWFTPEPPELSQWAGIGLAYVKIGLAHAGPTWRERWRILRDRISRNGVLRRSPSPAWIAVVYADWQIACAPHPREVLHEALAAETCSGVLIDTYDKRAPSPLDASWNESIACVRDRRSIALAGRIDVEAIKRLAPLEPDIIAVRGAACAAGDRLGVIDSERVARLAQASSQLPQCRNKLPDSDVVRIEFRSTAKP